MAFRHYTLYLLLLLRLVSAGATTQYLLPIMKDTSLNPQYYTTLLVGTPPLPVNLAVDLSVKFSWFTCPLAGYTHSSSTSAVPCNSPQCLSYGGLGCNNNNNNSCAAVSYTPWSDRPYSGALILDTISLPKSSLLPLFPFTCASHIAPLKGLSQQTKGVLTLARTSAALHSQLSSSLNLPRKFSLCLPSSSSSTGALYFGAGPAPSKSLATTALAVNPHSTAPVHFQGEPSIEYFINVTSIEVDGTPLKFKSSLLSFDKEGNGGVKICTLTPYTVLHQQIYKPLVGLFVAKAAALNVAEVAAVAPFGACFSSKSIRYDARTGGGLPAIDLVFGEKKARWRIFGSNYMVKVSEEVECLGFVGGAKEMIPITTSMVIGGKQLEDNVVEFDLEGKKVGFTSSLLRMGTSCSQLRGV